MNFIKIQFYEHVSLIQTRLDCHLPSEDWRLGSWEHKQKLISSSNHDFSDSIHLNWEWVKLSKIHWFAQHSQNKKGTAENSELILQNLSKNWTIVLKSPLHTEVGTPKGSVTIKNCRSWSNTPRTSKLYTSRDHSPFSVNGHLSQLPSSSGTTTKIDEISQNTILHTSTTFKKHGSNVACYQKADN